MDSVKLLTTIDQIPGVYIAYCSSFETSKNVCFLSSDGVLSLFDFAKRSGESMKPYLVSQHQISDHKYKNSEEVYSWFALDFELNKISVLSYLFSDSNEKWTNNQSSVGLYMHVLEYDSVSHKFFNICPEKWIPLIPNLHPAPSSRVDLTQAKTTLVMKHRLKYHSIVFIMLAQEASWSGSAFLIKNNKIMNMYNLKLEGKSIKAFDFVGDRLWIVSSEGIVESFI